MAQKERKNMIVNAIAKMCPFTYKQCLEVYNRVGSYDLTIECVVYTVEHGLGDPMIAAELAVYARPGGGSSS